MTILATFIDYHWDNYQGGSGQSLKFKLKIDLPDEMKVSEIGAYIDKEITALAKYQRPHRQDMERYAIQSLEILISAPLPSDKK